jgi:tripartite-type tricarboxylate transporter receptor subunit TctC
MELLARQAGVTFHHVPFKGTPEIISSLVAGDVQAFLISAATAVRYTKDGRLRVIATTGTERSLLVPDVPTVAQSGVPDYTYYTWLAMFTTAGTPAPVVDQLRAAFGKILGDPAIAGQFASQGWVLKGDGPDSVTSLINDDIERYGKIVNDLNLRVD